MTAHARNLAPTERCSTAWQEMPPGRQALHRLGCTMMSSEEVIRRFWTAMQANDRPRAAVYLTSDCVIDWPCSGERIVGRENVAAVQAQYPSRTGRWNFDIDRLVAGERTVVSEVTVSDGGQSARVVVFSEVEGDLISRQTEYWPTAYDPSPGREHLTHPTDRIP